MVWDFLKTHLRPFSYNQEYIITKSFVRSQYCCYWLYVTHDILFVKYTQRWLIVSLRVYTRIELSTDLWWNLTQWLKI